MSSWAGSGSCGSGGDRGTEAASALRTDSTGSSTSDTTVQAGISNTSGLDQGAGPLAADSGAGSVLPASKTSAVAESDEDVVVDVDDDVDEAVQRSSSISNSSSAVAAANTRYAEGMDEQGAAASPPGGDGVPSDHSYNDADGEIAGYLSQYLQQHGHAANDGDNQAAAAAAAAASAAADDHDHYDDDEEVEEDEDEDPMSLRALSRRADVDRTAYYHHGADIQGVNWEQQGISRAAQRGLRYASYNNFATAPINYTALRGRYPRMQDTGDQFYRFAHSHRRVQPCVYHFQLRHVLSCVDRSTLYHCWNNGLARYDTVTHKLESVVTLATNEEHVKLPTTLDARQDIVAVGTMSGEVVLVDPRTDTVTFSSAVGHDSTAICNYLSLLPDNRLITSNNDGVVRIFDLSTMMVVREFQFETPPNHVSLSPDRSTLVVALDAEQVVFVHVDDGSRIIGSGHFDYSFATAWHPSGQVAATGNQDTTIRIWDVRTAGSSTMACQDTLLGQMSAVRSLRYSRDGRLLFAAETADFVSLLDVASGYRRCQQLDMFGEIAGFTTAADDSVLYVGNAESSLGGIVEYSRALAQPYAEDPLL